MKYKTAKVISHPRAGSHYLAHLLNVNFFFYPDYLPLYAGHSDAHKKWLKEPSTAVFYIHRNVNDTMKSMYNLRNRFGFISNSYRDFIDTPMNIMHSTNIKSEAVRNIAGKKQLINKVDTALANSALTPRNYIYEHHIKWLSLQKKNFHLVAYENLIKSFDSTMLDIAKFLGSDKTEFIQEEQRVGWYDKNEHKENFS